MLRQTKEKGLCRLQSPTTDEVAVYQTPKLSRDTAPLSCHGFHSRVFQALTFFDFKLDRLNNPSFEILPGTRPFRLTASQLLEVGLRLTSH